MRTALCAAAAAACVLGCAQPTRAAAFEPEAVVRRVDRVATLALARAGERLVAAGERGRILVSADHGATWKVAASSTHQTLTSLAFTDASTGFATGHQGTLLRTEDGGITWSKARVDMPRRQALFAVHVAGSRGIAVGAYGSYLESADGGRTWRSRPIGPADFDRHLTGIAAVGLDGLIVAGEAGTLLASSDGGARWQALKSPYDGSFFGAIGLANGSVIAYGMRGNAYRSADFGKSWRRIDLGGYKGALQGASEAPDGSVTLSGADGLVAVSRDGGATFESRPIASRITVSAIQRTPDGWVVASPAGLRVVH